MSKVFIIAEAGVNHNGEIAIAKQLIDVAVDAGVDAVKFQTFKAEKLVTKIATKAKDQEKNTASEETQFGMLKKLELSESGHKDIVAYCKKRKIKFMSTPFDSGNVDFLDKLGMECFNIPSGEITNKPLIQHIAQKGKPIILSTGMSFLGEVEKAIGWVNDIWRKLETKPKLTPLHCVSNYPANVEDSNLLAIKTMKRAFGLPVGFSGHTRGIEISVAAVALGATVIEKHLTLDRNMSGPDHSASLEPSELKSMVAAIRNISKAIGDGIKRPQGCEKDIMNVARKSLVAVKDIKRGETFDLQSIAVKRPGTGIPPEFLDKIINVKATKNIAKDTVLSWNDF